MFVWLLLTNSAIPGDLVMSSVAVFVKHTSKKACESESLSGAELRCQFGLFLYLYFLQLCVIIRKQIHDKRGAEFV